MGPEWELPSPGTALLESPTPHSLKPGFGLPAWVPIGHPTDLQAQADPLLQEALVGSPIPAPALQALSPGRVPSFPPVKGSPTPTLSLLFPVLPPGPPNTHSHPS